MDPSVNCLPEFNFLYFFFIVYDDFSIAYKYILHKSQCTIVLSMTMNHLKIRDIIS